MTGAHLLHCTILVLFFISVTSYNYTLARRNSQWTEVVLDGFGDYSRPFQLRGSGYPSSMLVNLPVFVSLASVSFRVKLLGDTIKSILHGIVVPTHIFVFISQEPYLLDEGIQTIPHEVLTYVATGMVSIVYTENIGPHRKLLPILQRFYWRDVVIVTVDDDMVYRENNTLLYQLLRSYNQSDTNQVVALRSRRIGLCREKLDMLDWSEEAIRLGAQNAHETSNHTNKMLFSEYSNWKIHYSSGSSEMLVLPTGTGGVLYRPKFFHPIVFDPEFRRQTGTADDLMFRLACMAKGIKVMIGCRDLEHKGRIVRRCPVDRAFLSDSIHIRNHQIIGTPSAPKYNQNSTHPVHTNNLAVSIKQHRNLRVSLYKLNSGGGNDQQWLAAVHFLEKQGILNMSALVLQHGREREEICYGVEQRANEICSISSCSADGPKDKDGIMRNVRRVRRSGS